jgi:hypothetical protein
MKWNKYQRIKINLYLMLLVLGTMLVQSLHIYEHAFEKIHKHDQCSHSQDTDDDCAVCDFVFGFFVAPEVTFILVPPSLKPFPFVVKNISFSTSENVALPPHRGPPYLV